MTPERGTAVRGARAALVREYGIVFAMAVRCLRVMWL
jgi:hypothetical protein